MEEYGLTADQIADATTSLLDDIEASGNRRLSATREKAFIRRHYDINLTFKLRLSFTVFAH